MIIDIYIILGSLILSAFFSGMEIAFISANKLQVELEKDSGGITSKMVSSFYNNPSHFIGSMLIGNTLSLSIYTIFVAKLLEPFLAINLPDIIKTDFTVFLFQTVLASIVVIFTAEFLPKSIFLLNANKLLKFFSLPIKAINYVLNPISYLIMALAKPVFKYVLKIDFSEEKPVFGLTDLNHYVSKMTSIDDVDSENEIDTKILNNALDFKNIKVRECMIPRTEIIAVEVSESIEELTQIFVESGYSKILIYKESIDNIIGYCHSSELFKKPRHIKEILSSLIVVPETLLANELLEQLIAERKSIALIVDEFGGTAGIVTVEDVIEEIFGEIQDEHDDEKHTEKKISENCYLLSARHEIDYLNDKYNWNIPEGEYETLGGFILEIYEDIPQKNKVIHFKNFKITIVSTLKNRVEDIELEVKKTEG